MPAELHLLRPLWLLALLPLAVVWLLLARRRVEDRVWRSLVDPHLLPHLLEAPSGSSHRLPWVLLGLGWLLVVLALAGPVWQRLPAPVFTLDAKRVILLDISPSMNAADVPPSRLARARFEVLDLLRASREGQVALVAYGPEPFVVAPLTGDAATIAEQVPRLASDLIPVPGLRRVDRALEAAGGLLAAAGGGPGQVVLISDGVAGGGPSEGLDQARALAAARGLAEAGHRLSVLAVGTAEGAPVPGASGGFASGEGGSIPLSRLDRQGLQALARAGGGRVLDLDAGDKDTRALLIDAPASGPEVLAQEGLTADQWREEGPWLLLALLPLAALAFRRGWLLPVLACVALLPPVPGWALDWGELWWRPDQRGARNLAAGDPAAAASAFQDPAWRAAARYRAGDHGGALEDLAGLGGADVDYNRGNALARLGRLDDAIAAYERALQQAPEMEDARANLDLLRRLKEQQGPPPSDSDSGSQAERPGQGSQGGQPQSPADGQDGTTQQPTGGDSSRGAAEGGEGTEPRGQGQSDDDQADKRRAGEGTATQDPEQAKSGAQSGMGAGAEPSAADLGRGAEAVDSQSGTGPQDREAGARADPSPDRGQEGEPDQAQRSGQTPSTPVAGGSDATSEGRERRQALESQLRRVPDDPAGLLRQRFILQHLRREGKLP